MAIGKITSKISSGIKDKVQTTVREVAPTPANLLKAAGVNQALSSSIGEIVTGLPKDIKNFASGVEKAVSTSSEKMRGFFSKASEETKKGNDKHADGQEKIIDEQKESTSVLGDIKASAQELVRINAEQLDYIKDRNAALRESDKLTRTIEKENAMEAMRRLQTGDGDGEEKKDEEKKKGGLVSMLKKILLGAGILALAGGIYKLVEFFTSGGFSNLSENFGSLAIGLTGVVAGMAALKFTLGALFNPLGFLTKGVSLLGKGVLWLGKMIGPLALKIGTLIGKFGIFAGKGLLSLGKAIASSGMLMPMVAALGAGALGVALGKLINDKLIGKGKFADLLGREKDATGTDKGKIAELEAQLGSEQDPAKQQKIRTQIANLERKIINRKREDLKRQKKDIIDQLRGGDPSKPVDAQKIKDLNVRFKKREADLKKEEEKIKDKEMGKTPTKVATKINEVTEDPAVADDINKFLQEQNYYEDVRRQKETKATARVPAGLEQFETGLQRMPTDGGKPGSMTTSQKGIDLIKHFEGFRGQAYQDSAGIWTIGYGSTIVNGKKVQPGDTISQSQAESQLRSDVKRFEAAVAKGLVRPVSQEQFDALVSFTYNAGPGAFAKSTLLKKINQGDMVGASNEFGKWVHAGGKRVQGLANRRSQEAALFAGNLGSIPQAPVLVAQNQTGGPQGGGFGGANALTPGVASGAGGGMGQLAMATSDLQKMVNQAGGMQGISNIIMNQHNNAGGGSQQRSPIAQGDMGIHTAAAHHSIKANV